MFPNCPVRNILARVGAKWSLIVMHELLQHHEPMRFSALQKSIPDISQKMLTTTLRDLKPMDSSSVRYILKCHHAQNIA